MTEEQNPPKKNEAAPDGSGSSKDDKSKTPDYAFSKKDADGSKPGAEAPQAQLARAGEQERLIYRPLVLAADHPRRSRNQGQPTNHLAHVRERFEDILTRSENEPVVVIGVRNDNGLPRELIASCLDDGVYVRNTGGSGALNKSNFDAVVTSFGEAPTSNHAKATFVDSVAYYTSAGDIRRLIDGVHDEGVRHFEARLKDRNFRFVLIVIVDTPEGTSHLIENSCIEYLPWTDLWLLDFAKAQSVTTGELFARIGDVLRDKARWDSFDDDDREMGLYRELLETSRRPLSGSRAAIAAIHAAMEKAGGADDVARMKQFRDDLAKYLKPSRDGTIDPVKQVMLVVAAFSSGTRVREYDQVCRALLPEGQAEILRLPPAIRETVLRELESAERLGRERGELPGWGVVFDYERDDARSELQVHLRDGQAIELDSKWKIVDIRREITRAYPGVIDSLLRRIHDRRLFLFLSEGASEILIDMVCAIRDACDQGFDDSDLAVALTAAETGLGDLGTPRDIVEQLYPGLDPELVLGLINDVHNERLRRAFGSEAEREDDLVHVLHILEITPENFAAKLDILRRRLQEESVFRLTRRLLRMRSSRTGSENRQPIVTSMLDILDDLLSSETYVAMLTYMVANSPEVDVFNIGTRLQSKFARAGKDEIDDIVIAIHSRLRTALGWPKAPHANWLFAFDPVRRGKPAEDRIRALGVLLWDFVINWDVLVRVAPYEGMTHMRIVWKLFGVPAEDSADGGARPPLDGSGADDALINRVVTCFFACDPADWLQALAHLEKLVVGRFDLEQNIQDRITDTIYVIMTGATRVESEGLEKSDRLEREVLGVLTTRLGLGETRDIDVATSRVEKAIQAPPGRDRRWLALYGLFWPAMIAHWRFVAFGLGRFAPDTQADAQFRSFLDRIVAAVPQRMGAFREGFAALSAAAECCAGRADDMDLHESAARYRQKADRLLGLSHYFGQHVRDLPVKAS